MPPAVPLGNWPLIQNCSPGQVMYYMPTGTPATPDPEKWNTSPTNVADIWNVKGYTTIEQYLGFALPIQ